MNFSLFSIDTRQDTGSLLDVMNVFFYRKFKSKEKNNNRNILLKFITRLRTGAKQLKSSRTDSFNYNVFF